MATDPQTFRPYPGTQRADVDYDSKTGCVTINATMKVQFDVHVEDLLPEIPTALLLAEVARRKKAE